MMGVRKDVKLYREGVKQRYGQKKCSKTRVRFEGRDWGGSYIEENVCADLLRKFRSK